MSEPEIRLPPDPVPMSPEEARVRRGRNIALALGLVLFVVLVFVVSIVRMGASAADGGF
jgi:hypothetical protein